MYSLHCYTELQTLALHCSLCGQDNTVMIVYMVMDIEYTAFSTHGYCCTGLIVYVVLDIEYTQCSLHMFLLYCYNSIRSYGH